ncbi:helix-turn-helix domain-containing protein [Pseudozobellia thermophila]|uniref:Transcriptional regulator, AraC family n=1 Tax=Pseudozobellia thermophila TaxID=192903 RepID=A0A1M6MQ12_9FLAO|nr:helix-turn-helix domain-containing protein [Pseudozobellia thermophila]SHJ85496.1 transcriptional regulator, AraC family [Pseudozobellia thermophila]
MKFDIYTAFEAIGFVQAMTLGVLLIILNKPKYKSTLFLSVLLILFSLAMLPRILDGFGAFNPYPQLYLLPFVFFSLYFPLFYLYIQHTGLLSSGKRKLWLLLPGLVAFGAQSLIYILPYERKVELEALPLYEASRTILWLFGLGVGVYTLNILRNPKVIAHRNLPYVALKELARARSYLVYTIIGFILYALLARTVPHSLFARTYFMAFDLLFIYWTALHGFEQQNVRAVISLKKDPELANDAALAFNTMALPSEKKLITLMNRIHEYLIRTESFTNKELTVVDLAENLDSHPKRISSAINKVRNQNFNAYINLLRVQKAEGLLKNKDLDRLSIEGIGQEVGFHSKSAFYSAFKKVTGTTPLKYKGLR